MNVNGVNYHRYTIFDQEYTDLICCETGVALQIHASTPRCFMSIFLFKADGDTQQNIHFNVLNKLCASFIAKITFGK